ncbi:GerMN domain-containing protein [Desulfitibacter alkalitolerans]|uniref:GerMN domain-containing protein n=1 Tax=Desulfitibacter alkalitolerans TaxID=264641 RepID=UPI000A0286BB|nr:GerMN domain-containing protein [Desulfitibacter alkalitolerans]
MKMYIRLKVIIVLLLMAALLVGCGQNSSKKDAGDNETTASTTIESRPLVLNNEKDTVLVYFASENGRYLIPITLPIKPTKEAAKVSVEKVLAGPGDWLLSSTTPEDTKLKDIYIRRNIAYIDLTSHFKNFEEYEDIEMAINSLVLTVTEFQEVETVQFLVEGKVIEEINGFKLDKPFERPAYINSLSNINDEDKLLHVYFSDPNALYLIPVGFAVNKNSTISQMVESAMQELVKGPPLNSDLVKTIWSGTKLRKVDYDSEDKMATIDLSKEVMGYGGGAAAEVLLVKSILFTLTSIDGVDWVQILIEGDYSNYLPEGTDISRPIARPEYINFVNP